MRSRNQILTAIVLITLFLLSGCGSSNPASTNNGGTVTTNTYFKLAAGNTWNYNTTITQSFSIPLVGASSASFAASTTVTTAASTAGGLTPVLTNGVTTSHLAINASGGVDNYDALQVLQGTIPATLAPGSTFTMVNGSMTVSCTVAATNVTITVPAGTFTNVVQASYTITAGLPAGTTGTGIIYFSTLSGREVKNIITLQGNITAPTVPPVVVTATTTITHDLLPGYIAL